jgi:hypothetical protein
LVKLCQIGGVLFRRRFVKEMFCFRRPFVKETYCYGDVLLRRRFVSRHLVEKTFCKEMIRMRIIEDLLHCSLEPSDKVLISFSYIHLEPSFPASVSVSFVSSSPVFKALSRLNIEPWILVILHGVNTIKCESSYISRHFDFGSSLSKYKMKLNVL